MSAKELTCVVCPNGCPIVVNMDDDETPVITQIEGAVCKRGEEWVHQEIENPMRTIASSVMVCGGDSIFASVRTSRPIPLDKILDVMGEVKKTSVNAPVSIGDVIIRNPAGCDAEIIATRNVARIVESASENAKVVRPMREVPDPFFYGLCDNPAVETGRIQRTS